MKFFLSNIGAEVTEDSLTAVVSTFGKVDFLKIISDTQRNKGAYIEMPHEEEAALAIFKLNGSYVNGRILTASRFSVAS